jgi:hypothetical protein
MAEVDYGQDSCGVICKSPSSRIKKVARHLSTEIGIPFRKLLTAPII